MKYFAILNSTELKEIGFYPQTNFHAGYNMALPNSIHKLNIHHFADTPIYYQIDIDDRANPTNFIHSVGTNFEHIVDEDLKVILSQHKLPPHRFYPIEVWHKKKPLSYYIFHIIVDDFWDHLDTTKSSCFIYRLSDMVRLSEIAQTKEEIPVESRQQLLKLKDGLAFGRKLHPKKIVFKKTFPEYDFYQIRDVDWSYVISEKLKKSLEEFRATGYSLTPYRPTHQE
ncbi:hypothetical protein OZ410_06025 [Robiginitalea sp. M366]|uniref:hypothetical protein n=1 Tax=Robiginitalea aestuariiviva TaxID=3036903 RepID=UPI00240DDD46|nr:hypothetical protein [Robiginitalea aestuariiviva]MDG1571866.1 hypothetical protein [Robiginitalea aestuariiviva]